MENHEFAEMQAENARLKRALAAADNQKFLADLFEQGKLAPIARKQASELLEFAENYDNGETLNFSEGESFAQKVRDFLANQPKIVEFSEIATKENAVSAEYAENAQPYAENTPPEMIELDKQIRQHMRTHNTDYRTAFQAITGAK